MVLHSRDPALLFPDEPKGKSTEKNPCDRTLPGSHDCQGQVDKKRCIFQQHEPHEACECTGRMNAAGADVSKGKHFVAVKRLEEYQSTTKGRGHLSDVRAAHSSTVPFR
jgi:hypothetical protein